MIEMKHENAGYDEYARQAERDFVGQPVLQQLVVERKIKESQEANKTTLPTDAEARKAVPIASGVLAYFPDAIAAIAAVSYAGSQQHNPGKPLFWDRPKSGDHADCLMRHFMERGTIDTDGMPHSAKVAWRALAILQLEIEAKNASL